MKPRLTPEQRAEEEAFQYMLMMEHIKFYGHTIEYMEKRVRHAAEADKPRPISAIADEREA